jgi:DUF1680 family protein
MGKCSGFIPGVRNMSCHNGMRELEKRADRVFSEYVRLRGADGNGYCRCYTCGRVMRWNEAQAGHFISRAKKAIRYNEMNAQAQCSICNLFGRGESALFEKRLIEEYGAAAVEMLKATAKSGGFDEFYFMKQKIAEYREKVKRLKKSKCLCGEGI